MENKWQLTPEEIEKAWDMFLGEHPDCQWDSNIAGSAIAREAVKKFVEWLVFKKMEGIIDYSGHTCWMISMETLKELCKELGIEK